MADRHMKKMLNIVMICHLTLGIKGQRITRIGKDVEKRENCTRLCKRAWIFLKKVKIELLHDPEILPLVIHPKEMKSAYQRDTCTPKCQEMEMI
jgi:hypothetical protein